MVEAGPTNCVIKLPPPTTTSPYPAANGLVTDAPKFSGTKPSTAFPNGPATITDGPTTGASAKAATATSAAVSTATFSSTTVS